MKTAALLLLILLPVLLVGSLTWLTLKVNRTSDEKTTETSNQPTAAANGNASSSKNNVVTGSSEAQKVPENVLEENSKNADEPVPNGASETTSDQTAPSVSGNDATSANVPPPDGRIYLGGEEPYAYLPTYSPKERLPILPLPPDQ